MITRALGTDPDVEIDASSLEAQPGDVFLLCSDGLSTMVDADTIASLVDRNRDDLRGAATALIEAANDSGGDDNITAVLFELSSDGRTSAPAAPYVARRRGHAASGGRRCSAPPKGSTVAADDTMVVSAERLAARDRRRGTGRCHSGGSLRRLPVIIALARADRCAVGLGARTLTERNRELLTCSSSAS